LLNRLVLGARLIDGSGASQDVAIMSLGRTLRARVWVLRPSRNALDRKIELASDFFFFFFLIVMVKCISLSFFSSSHRSCIFFFLASVMSVM